MRAILILMVLGLGCGAAAAQETPPAGGPLRRMLAADDQHGQPARNVLRRAWRLRSGVVFPHQRPAS